MPLVLFALALAWAVMLLMGGLDLDRALLAVLYAGERPDVAAAARVVTELGGGAVLVAATVAGAAWLLLRRRFADAALLLALTLSGRLLVDLQKAETARLRPEAHEHLVGAQTLAFPSAHAANAAIVWFALALLATGRFPQRMLALWGAAWATVLVGASRVVLGVHWPSDVVAGWAFGLFWTLLVLRLAGRDLGDGTPRALRHSSRRRREAMTDRNDRGADRAETARQTDDSELIDGMEDAPSQGGTAGGNLQRDIAARDEMAQRVGDGGVTRVRDSDKGEEAGLPRFNEGNSKLNP